MPKPHLMEIHVLRATGPGARTSELLSGGVTRPCWQDGEFPYSYRDNRRLDPRCEPEHSCVPGGPRLRSVSAVRVTQWAPPAAMWSGFFSSRTAANAIIKLTP